MPQDDEYVSLAQRGWGDVTPVAQVDGENPLLPIMYSERYRDHMDYFRAVLASGEKSERVLELTEDIIDMVPGHYSVWQYRFSTLLATKADLNAELKLMTEFAHEHLKTYQVWHHRLLLVTELAPTDLTSEIEFIHDALLPDPKNYHTWAYLHWLYSHFSDPARGLERITAGMWESEQCWCDSLIAQDGRNNSAWGWRWFLRMARPGAVGATKPEEEIKYALDEIHRIPHNASAWNYLRGVLRSSGQARAPLLPVLEPYMAGAAIDLPPNSLEDATAWPARSSPINADTPTPVPAALEFLADALVELHNKAGAARVFAQLGGEADQMRAAYWAMRGAECA